METTQILLTVALVSLSIYLLGAFRNGVPKSISDSDYLRKKPFKYTFELTMYICGASIISFGTWSFIVSGVGFILVGVFSDFKRNKFFHVMHYIGAIGGFILLTFSFIYLGWWFYTVLIAVVATLFGLIPYLKGSKYWICYLEIAIAYTAFIGLTVYLILLKPTFLQSFY